MKQKLLAIVCILGLLVLVGCNRQDQTVGPVATPFVGGVEGLSMEFLQGAPPAEIFDDGQFPFSVNLLLENLGESDVLPEDGYVEITGINPRDFIGPNSNQDDLRMDIPERINGVRKNFQGVVLVGDKVVSEFNDLAYLPNIRGNFDGPRIRANLCYNYETEATAVVCVKRDLLTNIDTKEICEVSGEKPVFNSGSPIQITQVTQDPMGSDRIQVTFTIEHVGAPNDRFYKLDTDCDDSSTNPDKDKVFFEAVSDLNGAKLRCSGLQEVSADRSSGFVTLYNGNPQQIVCSLDTSSVDGVYEELITVNLGFRYYQFVEQRILVKDVSVNADE